ncbi:thermostable hemolysin [Thorsellia anophelis]|uniref:Thermostable hemolysin n=1 Tax=Thorsellia anophelis DSM 18579 TaxID=1123402 RepID=A0A1I0EZA7_9GAMM|nr:thermostable hemolysin [Thorsellia anophelis]SET50271.1 Thermostable hemolysin [Thorsellia anophelis DSM 18579]
MKLNLNTLHLVTIEPNDVAWPKVQQYVHDRYKIAFDAQLNTFMPHFMALFDDKEEIRSLCGFREGRNNTSLFLENYLDDSADHILSLHFQTNINREKMIEFGQLASFSRGISAYHFLLMTERLVEMGYEWCIFTATDLLHALIKHMGLQTTLIAYADPKRVANAEKIWGHYYEHQPRILAGNLIEGAKALRSHFNSIQSIPCVLDTNHHQAG